MPLYEATLRCSIPGSSFPSATALIRYFRRVLIFFAVVFFSFLCVGHIRKPTNSTPSFIGTQGIPFSFWKLNYALVSVLDHVICLLPDFQIVQYFNPQKCQGGVKPPRSDFQITRYQIPGM